MSLIIFFLAPITFDASIPKILPVYFVMLAIFTLTCLAVGSVLGLMIQNISKQTMIAQFIFLPSIMLSGIMFPANLLPNFLQGLGKIFPVTWGYVLMKQNHFDFSNLLPLLVIMICSLCIVAWRIPNLELD
ncbi:ABC transporter permease [Bacillus massiliigorillae]|uniref:ABC transporter permease n=1 Tax=Bacillus massiliigorillae TaxID=1243664 RepID=UPI0003A40788|nr:ABC transporter permease [Bacillus massiliigorillae]